MKKKPRKPPHRTPAPKKPRAVDAMRDLEIAARNVAGIRSMIDVPTTKCVPTMLPGLDRVIGLPGWPLSTISLFHGPPGDGKSALLVALMTSFQKAGGVPSYHDAELAADLTWFDAMGLDLRRALIHKPTSYEEVMQQFNVLLSNVRIGLAKRRFSHPGISFLAGLDSMSKAMPQEVLDKFGDGEQAVREAGRLQAAWNKHFVNVVNPLIYGQPVAVVVILHEGEGEKKGKYTPVKIKGGNAPRFEARIQLRVKAMGFDEEGGVRVAKVHLVSVWKNKLGGGGGETKFYTATPDGRLRGVPALDLGRSLFESAKDAKVARPIIVKDGAVKKLAGFEVGGQRTGDCSRNAWIDRLNKDDAEFERVGALVRAAPLEVGPRRARDQDPPPPEVKKPRAELLPPATDAAIAAAGAE